MNQNQFVNEQMEKVALKCHQFNAAMEQGRLTFAEAVQEVKDLYQLTSEMRRLLEESAKNPLYVFSLMDDGQLKRVIARESLSELKLEIQGVLEDYLAENGYEGTTEDGYAVICRVYPKASQEEEHVWSYCFDGEETVEEAIQRMIKKKITSSVMSVEVEGN